MLRLNNLKSPKGAHRNIKRIGRGPGSGQGCQAGKGHKGQKARSGGGTRTGFEGGALPLYMKLPKRGFKNALFKKEYAIFNLSQIEEKFDGGEVGREQLLEKGLLSGADKGRPLKLLGNGKISKSVTFVGFEKVSKAAKAAVEAAGGSFK